MATLEQVPMRYYLFYSSSDACGGTFSLGFLQASSLEDARKTCEDMALGTVCCVCNTEAEAHAAAEHLTGVLEKVFAS